MSNYEMNNRYSIYPLENRNDWARTQKTAFDRRPPKVQTSEVEENAILSVKRETPKRDLPFYGMAF